MNDNVGNGGGEISTKWVEEQLKRLSMAGSSGSLRSKLVAGIPSMVRTEPRTHRIGLWSGGMRWASAVAVIVLTASAVAWLGTPWGRRSRPIVDINSRSGQAYAADYNSLYPSDTNLCDINGLR